MRAAVKAISTISEFPVDNPGLVLQRCFPQDQLDGGTDVEQGKLLKRISQCPSTPVYTAAFDEFVQAMAEIGALTIEAELLSRMTIGLSSPSPNENGISLSQTYGMPTIPGSSIKGAMRSMAQEMLGLAGKIDPDVDPSTKPEAAPLFDTFGSVSKMAAISVFDGWWIPVSNGKPLVLETWTPHHQNYMTGGHELPLETEDPIPLKLLAVPSRAKFLFSILLPNETWTDVTTDLLKRTLARGLGAKQNQGYGRFKIV